MVICVAAAHPVCCIVMLCVKVALEQGMSVDLIESVYRAPLLFQFIATNIWVTVSELLVSVSCIYLFLKKIIKDMGYCIIEMVCGPAPERHARWTLRLLEEKSRIELDTSVSKDVIGRALKKRLRFHKNYCWCIPSKEDAEFAACMEDVLYVYEMPYNAMHTVVCMDD